MTISMPSKTKRKKVVKAWAGFSEGKISYELDHYQHTEVMAVFKTRWRARKHYRDVRRVTITIES